MMRAPENKVILRLLVNVKNCGFLKISKTSLLPGFSRTQNPSFEMLSRIGIRLSTTPSIGWCVLSIKQFTTILCKMKIKLFPKTKVSIRDSKLGGPI